MLMMRRLKAVVGRGGAVVVQDHVDYPEGTKLELDVHEPVDELDDEELAALDDALERSAQSAREGRVRPASELIARMRASR